MKTLLEAATVKTGDGNWMSGYEADPGVEARTYNLTGQICSPTTTPNPSGTRTVVGVKPFIIETKQKFSTLCEPADADKSAAQDLVDATEYLAGKQLWNGSASNWTGTDYFAHASVATVAVGATTVASIAAALQKAYDNNPSLVGRAVVHLGLTASLSLPSGFEDDHPNLTLVENAGYPTNGVAVSGPLTISLSDPQTVGLTVQGTNDVLTYVNRFAAVEFDPRLAVRAA